MSFVLLDDQGTGKQLVFRDPEAIITATSRKDLPQAFAQIEAAQRDGKWLAGWMSYELGYAFETRLYARIFNDNATSLLRLGICSQPRECPPADCLYTRGIPH